MPSSQGRSKAGSISSIDSLKQQLNEDQIVQSPSNSRSNSIKRNNKQADNRKEQGDSRKKETEPKKDPKQIKQEQKDAEKERKRLEKVQKDAEKGRKKVSIT